MSRRSARDIFGVQSFCIVFVLVGTGVFVYGWIVLDRAGKSPDWPTANATVVYSVYSDGYDVRYTYKVNGRTFRGNHVGFGEKKLTFDSDDQRQVVRRYPKGKVVEVYYDPGNPEVSVLEPGIRRGTYMFPGVGLLVSLFAIGFLLLHRRFRPRRIHAAASSEGDP